MKISQLTSALLLSSAAAFTQAQELDIKITNLTQGIYFTPLLIGAHTGSASLFSVGEMASTELQTMAEGGNVDPLEAVLDSISADSVKDPAAGLLAPGMSTMTELSTSDGNMYLSITAMMLPTNDGFVGLDSWMIPSEAGTYHIYLNAYDAGTEANDEIVNGGGAPGTPGIPASPGGAGTGGTGVTTTEDNTYIHIHRGNLGDDNPTGGASDIHSTVERWLNPVAMVTVTVE